MLERRALIFNVQKYNTFDGPGVRTIIFFKGCPLRCKWCSNPEGQDIKYNIMFRQNMCTNCGNCTAMVCPVNIHVMSGGSHQLIRTIDCLGCRACEKACPQSAIAILGETKTISELLEIVEKDMPFYNVSGGGVTLSGGDVILQPEAAANLLSACKQNGINTAVETSGYGKLSSLLKIAEFTDLFLYDIKLMDTERHFRYIGIHNNVILENVQELLKRKYKVMIRVPLLKGINDDTDNITHMTAFLKDFSDYRNFEGVNLLPYHKMSIGKYAALGRVYPLEGDYTMSEERLLEIERMMRDVKAVIIRH